MVEEEEVCLEDSLEAQSHRMYILVIARIVMRIGRHLRPIILHIYPKLTPGN